MPSARTDRVRGRARAFLALAIGIAAALAGCGSGSDEQSSSGQATPGTTATASDATTTAAGAASSTASAGSATPSTTSTTSTTANVAVMRVRRVSSTSSSSGTTTTTTTSGTSSSGSSTTGTSTTGTSTTGTSTTGTSTTTTTSTGTTSSAGSVVPVLSGGYGVLDAAAARLWGPGLYTIDALGNRVAGDVGGYSYLTSQRFRAPYSGNLATLRPYWADGSGYAAGNGGTVRIRLMPDDGTASHLPNMAATPLASTTYQPALVNGQLSSTTFNAPVSFASPPAIVAGTLYHLVYDNVDAAPAVNYVSLNNQVSVPQNGRVSRWMSPIDWGQIVGYRTVGSTGSFTWRDESLLGHITNGTYYVPILQLTLADGRSFGNTDMETGNVDPARQWSVSASTPVRERFTPRSARTVAGVGFATATTTGGSLLWELRDGTTLLASGTVSEAAANYSTSTALGITSGVFKWYDVALPSTVTLAAGRTYDLQLTPQGGSQWRFADERNGSTFGYANTAAWSESQAQVYSGSSWLDADHWSHASSTAGSNWRVMLYLAP